MTSHVVATAGHVDHGKSTLVRALTGTDPDRWAEEKARGLTIDLGFAALEVEGGHQVSFVDVPGHTRFVKNMLAGVGGVDAAVFVVAATEGWKPQSEEHLRILELVGIEHGVVALTKLDLVDADLLELAQLDVEEHVEGTFLEGAPVVAVDGVGGDGLEELRAAIAALVARTPQARDDDRPRLWIDRAFAAIGSGTVVTGTLAGGSLGVGDEVATWPGTRRARIRALQSHGSEADRLGPGTRVAVNLTGVSHHEIERGACLTRPGQWHPTLVVDASLSVLADLDHDVSRRGAFQAYIGSGEHAVPLRVLGPDALAPGTTGFVRLRLPQALPLLPGDRYVLRESGRRETVGGGEILDIEPVLPASRAAPSRSVDRVIAERGWVEVDELELLTGEARAPTLGRWATTDETVAALAATLRERIEAAGALGLDLAELDDRERAVLDTLDGFDVDATRVKPQGAEDPLADHPFVAALEAEAFAPPAADGVDRAELGELVRRGLVVESEGLHYAPAAIDQAAREIATLLADEPEGVTVSQVRDALGTSRKHVLPILAVLDRTGVTRRRGDRRIGGPRLP